MKRKPKVFRKVLIKLILFYVILLAFDILSNIKYQMDKSRQSYYRMELSNGERIEKTAEVELGGKKYKCAWVGKIEDYKRYMKIQSKIKNVEFKKGKGHPVIYNKKKEKVEAIAVYEMLYSTRWIGFYKEEDHYIACYFVEKV